MSQPKVALVTGTSSGFGLLTSVALAEAGFLVVASMRDLAKQGPLMDAARRAGVDHLVSCIRLDVTEADQIGNVVAQVLEQYGRIDVLMNNAGFAVGGVIEEVPMAAWRTQMETNLFGTIAMTKAVLPHMRMRGSGTIVNISSVSGRVAFPGLGPYVTSKHALEGFTETLRMEMLPYGIKVILIEPGSYMTDIWSKGLKSVQINPDSPYAREIGVVVRGVRQIATKSGDPTEVARLIVRVLAMGRPRLRYATGKGVLRMITLKTLLPWKWIERIVSKRFMKGEGRNHEAL